MSKEISRRKFLRMAGLTAAGVFFSSCASKEPTSTSKPEPKGSEPIATVKPTETRLPPTPTAVLTRIPAPTEAPKPTPTEILREKWGKVWILGGGEGTGGPESGLPKEEERFGSFIEQITRQLEQKGESLKQTELFVGAFPKPLLNEKGKPKFQTVGDQPAGEWLFCAFVFSKTGERKVYCATEQERGIEAQVGAVSEVFTPEPKIWGTGCWEKIDGSRVLSCTDGTTYKPEKTVFGADLTKLTLVSGEETMTGYIFTAVPFQQEQSSPLTFFLSIKDEEKLPFLPSGKEKFDLEKFIAVFDLASARWNVWEDNLEKDYPYVGYWDLEKGEWAGEKNYEGKEGYQKLFVEKSVLPEPTPTLSPEEEQLYADIVRIYGGEQSVDTDIFKALENAKKFDPQKFPENMDQYTCYTIIASRLIGKYYASSGVPENRNPEILKVLAQIREMARQNSRFYEEDWKVDYVDSY